jgi:hypothetical protein
VRYLTACVRYVSWMSFILSDVYYFTYDLTTYSSRDFPNRFTIYFNGILMAILVANFSPLESFNCVGANRWRASRRVLWRCRQLCILPCGPPCREMLGCPVPTAECRRFSFGGSSCAALSQAYATCTYCALTQGSRMFNLRYRLLCCSFVCNLNLFPAEMCFSPV